MEFRAKVSDAEIPLGEHCNIKSLSPLSLTIGLLKSAQCDACGGELCAPKIRNDRSLTTTTYGHCTVFPSDVNISIDFLWPAILSISMNETVPKCPRAACIHTE